MERQRKTSCDDTATVDATGSGDGAERLLAVHKHLLSRIALGCPVTELMSLVACYVERFAPGWHVAVHLVDANAGHLVEGFSNSLDRALLERIEALPLAEAWPIGTAFTGAGTLFTSSSSRPWSPAYQKLEDSFEVSCGAAVPAVSSTGAVLAMISIFRESTHTLPAPPAPVLDVASSLLLMGIERVHAMDEAERRLQVSEERYALAARGSKDGLWDWDLTRDVMRFSSRWGALLGLDAKERRGSPEEWWQRVHPEDRLRVERDLALHLDGKTEVFESQHRMVHRDGRHLWVSSRGEAIRDSEGRPTRVAGSLTDITKQKLAEERLRHDALHDDLTGLPNRAMFMGHLARTLKRAKHSKKTFQVAVLFLDFDRFKRINDSLGHLVGDQLLVAIAERLGSCIRPSDTVSRLGGDEFAILLEPVDDVTQATRVADRIHQSLREPFRVSGLELFITVSIGIVIGSSAYDRPEEILRDADTAMYRAKAAGKARHEVFDEAMHERAIEQLRLESALRMAIRRREFDLHYQPIVSLQDNAIVGLEALTRWIHPVRGALAPSAFLPVAEESGLIVEIGWWVLREACQRMSQWQGEFPQTEALSIHVNVSEKQLFQAELPERIESILLETGLKADRLVLDIPENVIMQNAESSVTILAQLKSLSIRIHLDDFGTGYSSLGYLHRFQIETLKIDRSFIRHLSTGSDNWIAVRAIVSLAENLGMNVIAEGVEREDQVDELRKLACKSAQGNFFHLPASAERTAKLLSQLAD